VLRGTKSRGLCGLVGPLRTSCVFVVLLLHYLLQCVCITKMFAGGLYITLFYCKDLIQSCASGGRRIVEDMCYEIRRSEACMD
jgi:hypothetical protein